MRANTQAADATRAQDRSPPGWRRHSRSAPIAAPRSAAIAVVMMSCSASKGPPNALHNGARIAIGTPITGRPPQRTVRAVRARRQRSMTWRRNASSACRTRSVGSFRGAVPGRIPPAGRVGPRERAGSLGLRIRRSTRRSPIRCSTKRIIHSWSMLSNEDTTDYPFPRPSCLGRCHSQPTSFQWVRPGCHQRPDAAGRSIVAGGAARWQPVPYSSGLDRRGRDCEP
jgi:hypothetical protein